MIVNNDSFTAALQPELKLKAERDERKRLRI